MLFIEKLSLKNLNYFVIAAEKASSPIKDSNCLKEEAFNI